MRRSTLNRIVMWIFLILAGGLNCLAQTTQGGIVGAIREDGRERGGLIPCDWQRGAGEGRPHALAVAVVGV